MIPGCLLMIGHALLADESVFTTGALEIMKRMKDYGGMATCTQLAVKYGETKNFYNSGSVALAKESWRLPELLLTPEMIPLQVVDNSLYWS
jgi:hypothetical protein